MAKVKVNQKLGTNKNCLYCKQVFYVQRNVLRRGTGGRFCSRFCYHKSLEKKIIKNCLVCKKEFTVWPSYQIQKFCSHTCYGRTILREHHHRWNPLSSFNQHLRNSKQARAWAKAVKKRDDYTCQLCNIRGGILHSDHIKPFLLYPELRFTLSNGRTLCKGCHLLTNTWGGRVHTSKVTYG